MRLFKTIVNRLNLNALLILYLPEVVVLKFGLKLELELVASYRLCHPSLVKIFFRFLRLEKMYGNYFFLSCDSTIGLEFTNEVFYMLFLEITISVASFFLISGLCIYLCQYHILHWMQLEQSQTSYSIFISALKLRKITHGRRNLLFVNFSIRKAEVSFREKCYQLLKSASCNGAR